MESKDFSQRIYKKCDVKLKNFDNNVEDGTFSGYLSTFGNKDRDDDIVVRGAFSQSIKNGHGALVLLYNHDTNREMGYVKIHEDEVGLFMNGQFNLDIEDGRISYSQAKLAKKMDAPFQFSMGYMVNQWHYDEKLEAYMLTEVDVYEASRAPVPANVQALLTDVKNNDNETDFNNVRHFEKHLRDVCGFSTKKAKRIASLTKTYRDDGLTEEEFNIAEEEKSIEAEKMKKLADMLGIKTRKDETND